MTAPDLTKLTLAELRRIAIGDGTTADDPYAAVDELHRRAQANDALLSTLSDWCFRRGADLCPTAGSADSFGEGMRAAKERVRRMLDAAAPAAPPTPAVPVTDAEIEAAITALTVDARREADALRVNPEASGAASEKRANRQVQLRSLIARRVASAGAAPVDSEREAAIKAWRKSATDTPCQMTVNGDEIAPLDDVFEVHAETIKEGLALMRSAPPAPAGDQDAKLRELLVWVRQFATDPRDVEAKIESMLAAPAAPAGDQDAKLREAVEALETVATKQQKVEIRDAAHRILRGYSPCTNCGKWMHRSECHWPCNPIAPVAAPAASAIAAAPEAPKREPWEERWNEAETGSREELLALRDGLSSHARRIEALERAAQEGSK